MQDLLVSLVFLTFTGRAEYRDELELIYDRVIVVSDVATA